MRPRGVRLLDNSFLVNYIDFVKNAPGEAAELERHTGFWLRFVSNHVSKSFARKLGGSGATVAEWVILRELYGAGGTAPSGIAVRTGLTRGAVSKLVDRLVRKGLATRTDANGDRRFQEVALTARGRAVVPKLAALADRNDEEFFTHLTAKERESLMAVLKKLVAANGLKTIPTD